MKFKDRVKLGVSPSTTVTTLEAKVKDRVMYCCKECGGTSVYASSQSYWSMALQKWVHDDLAPEADAYCDDCGEYVGYSEEYLGPPHNKDQGLLDLAYDGDKAEPVMS